MENSVDGEQEQISSQDPLPGSPSSKAMSLADNTSVVDGDGESVAAAAAAATAEKVAGLNNKLRQSMAIIKTLKASEVALQATVRELGDSLAARILTIENHEVTIAHLTNTCDGLKTELRKSDKEADVVGELVQKLQSTQLAMQRQSQELEEKTLALQQSKDMYDLASGRMGDLETELRVTKQNVKEASRVMSSSTLQKAEMDALLDSLRKDLQKALSNNERLNADCQELQAYKDRTSVELARFVRDSADSDLLKTEMQNKNAMVVRLQSEAQKAEQNHAMRTAMLAAAEEQVTQLSTVVREKEALFESERRRCGQLQQELAASNGEKQRIEASCDEQIRVALADSERALKSSRAEVSACVREKEAELDSVRREHVRKAAMARNLLAEKEAELGSLSEKLGAMQEEIDSGAPAERKIFALARAQSQREYTHSLHVDTREIAFQNMQEQVTRKDLELAEAMHAATALQAEVADLRRVSRREGVNMDYVKNVILQFMTFAIHAPERQSLVPVIGMLLQFDKKEAELAMRATANPSWEPRAPKEIDSVGALARSSHGSSHA